MFSRDHVIFTRGIDGLCGGGLCGGGLCGGGGAGSGGGNKPLPPPRERALALHRERPH